MPKSKKFSTRYPGVRYRNHLTRTHNGKPDQYYTIRYQIEKKSKEEGVGWASEGMNPKKASLILARLKEAQTTGQGPRTLKESRKQRQDKETSEKARKEKEARDQIEFGDLFSKKYFPEAKENKSWNSCRSEKLLFDIWIKPVIGDLPLKEIAPIHLERLKRDMKKAGKAPRSIHYALAVIRQVYHFAIDHDLYSGKVPTTKVKIPKYDNRRFRFLTKDEADQLLAALRFRSAQVCDICLISLHCGLRASEIFSLTWGDVDIEQGILLIRDPKTIKSRTAIMTSAVKECLQNKTPGDPEELVFKGNNGKKITAISRTFERTVKDLGLNKGIKDRRMKVVFHTLRHTYASWMVQSGVDLYKVKELLGHSTISQTERYAHLSKDSLREAVKEFEGMAVGDSG